MTKKYFSRITLKKDAHVAAIAQLLLPKPTDKKDSVLADRHSLVWSLFAKDKKQRDFAKDEKKECRFFWREDKYGLFYTLSKDKPKSDFFDIDTKEYEPTLRAGDMLAFSLRANPILYKKKGDKRAKKDGTIVLRRRKVDVVMDALKPFKKEVREKGKLYERGERRGMRDKLILRAGTDWLKGQGERNGFAVQSCRVDSYFRHKLPRKNAPDMQFSTLDYDGVLQITNPAEFLEKLDKGFGSAKGFGCGLMMIRRL